jgi:hypothetical protein
MARIRNNPNAPLIAPNAVLRLTVVLQTAGNIQENVWDFMSLSGTFSIPADQAALQAVFSATWLADYQAALTADTEIISTTVADLVPGVNPTTAVARSSFGSTSGHSLPLEMQATLRKVSALKGQHGYGRVMFPAVPTTFVNPAVNPNLLTAGTAYTAIGAVYVAGFAGSGTYGPCVVTRVVQPTPPTPPISPVPTRAVRVTATEIQLLLGTQLRRRPGRGI